MECPEALDLMGEALEGSLGRAVRVGFEEHLAECTSCGAYFEQLRVTTVVLRTLPPGPSSPRRPQLLARYRDQLGGKPD
jgi:predicted anti-sigma-YlaC factor YlaD